MGKKNKNENQGQLTGIKAIAEYLDMSIRNIYNWEKKLGLPIHRVSGSTGYRIYAYKEEIDRWLKEKDDRRLKRKKRFKKIFLTTIISIFILIFVLLLLFLITQLPGDESNGPATFTVDRNIIHVRNSKGGIIWNINHGNITDEKSLKLLLDMRNIDNDPQKEVIACICDMLRKDKHSITLFDHDGRMIWKRMMSPKFTFSKIDINNYFRPSPAKFGRTNTNEIFVISKWNHQERFLSIIACHDLEGNLVSQYHHVGNLSSTLELIDLNGDGGDEIVFTGTNNLLNGEGIVGVLPLRTFYGISPPYRVEPEYSHLEFRLNDYLADEIIRGNHLVYLRFKRTDHLSRYMPQYITPVIRYFSNNVIHINLQLWKLTPNKAQIGFGYVFDKNFTLHRILPPDVILEKYHGLLKNGEIDIPLKELMNIYSKIVLRWEPGSERWVPVKRAHSN